MNEVFHVTFPGLGDWASFTLRPVAFEIFGYPIKWYGIIIAVGFLLAFFYVMKNAARFGLNTDKLIDAVIVGLICGIIGARLYYVIFYPGDQYLKDPISILYIHEGGLAIYGGVIGGLLGGVLMARRRKLNVMAVLDIAVIGFLIGQGIGRWANFVNQEAFGSETSLPWGMVSEGTLGVPVHPCFLYESLWCLLGVLLLHLFSKKYRRYDGQVFLLYLVWYGVERFVVEGLRTDSLYIGGLRVSQVLAILTAVIGIVLLIVFRNRRSLCVNKQGGPLDMAVALEASSDGVLETSVQEEELTKEPDESRDSDDE
jgi:phosphatidylglycerol:prolipoprotein diacylglycerol transferase